MVVVDSFGEPKKRIIGIHEMVVLKRFLLRGSEESFDHSVLFSEVGRDVFLHDPVAFAQQRELLGAEVQAVVAA